ncbi:MAG: LPP20 family lipoprotein [Treponema sp.]|jgi:hypothetical protein|nr:LPP20 family lipoprotein [Treponema sp.]
MSKIKHFSAKTAALSIFALALFACASTPRGGGAEPGWLNDPYQVYNRATTIAAVGYGSSRDSAEKAAFTALTAIFGQSIQSESVTSYSYTQALEASGASWSENSDVAQAVKTSVNMDTLIGAEIKDVYRGADGTWYAAAALDKARASMIYSDLINQNLASIANLANLSAAEKQSFEGILKYHAAAALADANRIFANVKNVISPGSMLGENLKTGADFRLAAAEIAKAIPIAVTVENDRNNRVKGAFSGALASAGFRTGGTNSRYVLSASVVLEEASFAGNPYKWIRYVVDSGLTDTSSGAVLFPYSVNGREGHNSISEAQNRSIQAIEKDIGEKYLAALLLYLAQSPGK